MNTTNQSYAVFTKNIPQTIPFILKIKEFINATKQNYDFFIFSDIIHDIPFSDIGIMQSYYMKFYQGTVIFLDIKDYLENSNILANKIVYLNNHSLGDINISKNDVKILTIENDTIKILEN